eukprot:TRINITY_DN3807_c0_g2_i3.p1 TRINITY_DN3807_c0_g2~~TRINITY_DN3807_c0_g2_i3.p1  ORF type:complete len:431 (+),score=78.85 TRINITY_DN3807_c0_g2_i3:66-1358(+)
MCIRDSQRRVHGEFSYYLKNEYDSMALLNMLAMTGVSMVILGISVAVFKSRKIPSDKTKYKILIGLMAAFIAIVLINEGLATGGVGKGSSIGGASSGRFGYINVRDSKVVPPFSEETHQFLRDNIPELFPRNAELHPNIFIIYGDEGIGKSHTFSRWAADLARKDGATVLYVEPPHEMIDEVGFSRQIESFNARNQTPIVIVDGADKLIENPIEKTLTRSQTCATCDLLVQVWDRSKMVLVFVLDKPQSEEILLNNPTLVGKAIVKHLKPRTFDEFRRYVFDKVNPLIKEPERKFNQENAEFFYQVFGFRFPRIEAYLKRTDRNVEGYCNDIIRQAASHIRKLEITDLALAILDFMVLKEAYLYQNHWVPFSLLRTKRIEDLTYKFSKAVDNDIIVYCNGLIKFKSREVLNAVLRLSAKTKYGEIVVKND